MSIMEEMGLSEGQQQRSRKERDLDLAAIVRDDLASIHSGWLDLNETLRGVLGAKANVDEMALIFPGDAELLAYLRYAVRVPGYELFNAAYDHVHVEPIRTGYDASYWFMTTPDYVPDVKGYRLELMVLAGGYSPLHNWLADKAVQREEMPYRTTIHGSFKCSDEEGYAEAVHALRSAGYESIQRCRSSYGRFSYWMQQDPDYWKNGGSASHPAWLLKPRVNLRDAKKVGA